MTSCVVLKKFFRWIELNAFRAFKSSLSNNLSHTMIYKQLLISKQMSTIFTSNHFLIRMSLQVPLKFKNIWYLLVLTATPFTIHWNVPQLHTIIKLPSCRSSLKVVINMMIHMLYKVQKCCVSLVAVVPMTKIIIRNWRNDITKFRVSLTNRNADDVDKCKPESFKLCVVSMIVQVSNKLLTIFSLETTKVPLAGANLRTFYFQQVIVDVKKVSFVIDCLVEALFPFTFDFYELFDVWVGVFAKEVGEGLLWGEKIGGKLKFLGIWGETGH